MPTSKDSHAIEACCARNGCITRQKRYPSNGWKIRITKKNPRYIVPIKKKEKFVTNQTTINMFTDDQNEGGSENRQATAMVRYLN